MNREQNSNAIDRENITWKQNYSSGGSRMIQSEPECLAHDGCCETPSPSLPRGSATPTKCGPANSEADSGQPTSTRTLHPILDLHELKSGRDEHLAVIQSEMVELARLAEVGKKLRRQHVALASALTMTVSAVSQFISRTIRRHYSLKRSNTQSASSNTSAVIPCVK